MSSTTQKAKPHVDVARQLEFERKRTRGEISCAECRRLKLKCDKKIPCASCKRRGCPTICPNGTLSAGQGTRFVLADTNALHDKLNEMSERIRQLEDGLQLAHSAQSSQPHPLLSDTLLTIKKGVVQQQSRQQSPETIDSEEGRESEVLETFGTLRIGDDGATRFLGPSAASEGLLLLEAQGREENEAVQLHELLSYAGNAWPFSTILHNKDEVMELVLSQLPSWERASSLSESYLANVCRHSGMVDRSQLIEELLPSVYRRRPDSMKKPASPHDVALVFVIFALGAAGDLTQPPNNNECQLYKQLAQVALGLQSVFSFVSLSTVQAVALLANVDLASSRKFTLEEAWKVFSFALLLGKSIGIHRDPSRWNLGDEAIDMRRRIFWELYNVDNWQSLASGRPPIFSLRTTDVEYPIDKEAKQGRRGRVIPSFARTRFRLVKEVLAPVGERLSSCSTPLRYIDILNLDRKIREFDDFGVAERYEGPDLVGPELLEKLQVQSCRDIVLVYLHRNFFAKALLDNPTDPLKHKFAPSFLAAYRSASQILKLYNEAFKNMGELTTRFWPSFAHILASGAVVGAIPAHCPKYALAHHAYKEIDLAIDAFRMLPQHPVSQHGLPILYRLKERGYRALFGDTTGIGRPEAPIVVPLDEGHEYEELQILKGSPLVLANRRSPESSSGSSPSSRVTSGAQQSETGHSTRSSPGFDMNYGQQQQNHQDQLPTPSASAGVTSPSPSTLDSTGPIGALLQDDPNAAPIHPDLFRWIASLDSSTNFDESAWLQTSNEAASTVVTESDLAASLAMFQSYSNVPQAGGAAHAQSSPESLANTGIQDYNVDMSLFLPQYSELGNQGPNSATNHYNTSTSGMW